MARLKGAAILPFDNAISLVWQMAVSYSCYAAIVEKLVSLQLWFFFDNSYNIENSNGTYIEDL